MRRSLRGMSLMELLTIVAIIAIVAAIMFPVMAGKKENERKARCMGNLNLIGAAISMYERDNNGRVLPCSETWWYPLRHYLRARARTSRIAEALVCPSTPARIGLPPEPRFEIRSERDVQGVSAYAYNVMLGSVGPGTGEPPDYGPPKFLAQVVYPAKTVRITEMWRITSNDGCGKAYPPSYQAQHNGVIFARGLSPQFVLPPGWHNGRSWVLWTDGHASAMNTSQPRIPAEDPPPVWQVGVMENDPADKWFTTSRFKGG